MADNRQSTDETETIFVRSLRSISNWVTIITGYIVEWYAGFVILVSVIGFFILIAVVASMPVWFIAILGFPEAILIALLLWIRAITADVEAEIRSQGLHGADRRRFQRERVKRAQEIANSSRQWAILAIVIVVVYATSPYWLPVVKHSPIAYLYTVSRYKSAISKERAGRQLRGEQSLSVGQKRAKIDMINASETAYRRGAQELSRSSRQPEE